MKAMKKLTALCLSALLLLSLAACGSKTDDPAQDDTVQEEQQTPDAPGSNGPSQPVEEEPAAPADTGVTVKVAAMTGPTGMGLVQLMETVDKGGKTANNYEFTLAASADEVNPKIIQGQLDMACVPANVASLLYSKTNGGVQVLAVNTLGVIYIVENGDSIKSIQDLSGKTIVAAGKGQTPEYGLVYLLEQYGVKDVNIEWKSEHSECVAALASGAATIAMIPQPFVTVAKNQIRAAHRAGSDQGVGESGQRLQHAHRCYRGPQGSGGSQSCRSGCVPAGVCCFC